MAEFEVNQDVNTLKEDLNRLRNDVATLSDSLKKVVGGGAEAGRAKALEELENLFDQFKDRYDSLRQETKRARTGLEKEIEDRPFMALLGAFVVGVVLGKVMSSR
jgi:ElaB/YqjD/DUF883 family membrane-anchored ribosome-binding protein